MIKVSVLYPNSADSRFDMNYYCEVHIPMVQGKLGAACERVAVERGLSGAAPGSNAEYMAIGHLYFESIEIFQNAFDPHAEVILADIPNYTNVQPVFQVSDVVI